MRSSVNSPTHDEVARTQGLKSYHSCIHSIYVRETDVIYGSVRTPLQRMRPIVLPGDEYTVIIVRDFSLCCSHIPKSHAYPTRYRLLGLKRPASDTRVRVSALAMVVSMVEGKWPAARLQREAACPAVGPDWSNEPDLLAGSHWAGD